MENRIHIPEPCSEKWNNMKDVGNSQRHCDVCKHTVHDFSKKSLYEINYKINSENGKKLCGHYHERHTNNIKSIYRFTNRIDNTFSRTRLRRVSLLLISAVLLFSGCARRRLSGAYSAAPIQKNKKPQVEQIKI